MRIVSLLASGTEIVCALGAGESLVGRSHECDNPEWVIGLPSCTRPAFDISLPSAAIDAEVRRRLRAGEPLYHVDADRLRSLTPDLVITQVHCQVCAVTPSDVQRGGCMVPGEVLALSGGTVAGIYEDVERVAGAIGCPDAGASLVTNMRARIAAVTAAVTGRRAPSVVLLEWIDPVFPAGNWAPELIDAAGGRSLLGRGAEHSSAIGWEAVVEADPEYLIVAPCGFSLARTLREIDCLERRPGWSRLRAVADGRVFLADGNRYFNRSGVTIVDTVEMLAEMLHDYRPASTTRGVAWILASRLTGRG